MAKDDRDRDASGSGRGGSPAGALKSGDRDDRKELDSLKGQVRDLTAHGGSFAVCQRDTAQGRGRGKRNDVRRQREKSRSHGRRARGQRQSRWSHRRVAQEPTLHDIGGGVWLGIPVRAVEIGR